MRAEIRYQKGLAVREKVLVPEHPEALAKIGELAVLLFTNGQYADAEHLLLRVLALGNKASAPDQPNALATINNLAVLFASKVQYQGATPLLLRVLTSREKHRKSEHSEADTAIGNIAMVYRLSGRYDKSAPLLLRALSITDKALGSEHSDTLLIRSNLSLLFNSQGRSAEVEPPLFRVLAWRTKVNGPDHLEVGPLLLDDLDVLGLTFGSSHPDVAATLRCWANVYENQESLSEAELLLLRAVAICVDFFDKNHRDIAATMVNLAAHYRPQCRTPWAESPFCHAFAINEMTLGLDHSVTASRLSKLAQLVQAARGYLEAETLSSRALVIRKKIFGSSYELTTTIRAHLDETHKAGGCASKGEKFTINTDDSCSFAYGPCESVSNGAIPRSRTLH